MRVPVNELNYELQYKFYNRLKDRKKIAAGCNFSSDILIEWDKARLKLCPDARKQYAEIDIHS